MHTPLLNIRTSLSKVLIVLLVTALGNNSVLGGSTTVIADALDWYSTWFSQRAAQTSEQTCAGEFLDRRYELRCDPLNVTVSLEANTGECSVSAMRPSVLPEEAVRFPSVPTPTTPQRGNCGEL